MIESFNIIKTHIRALRELKTHLCKANSSNTTPANTTVHKNYIINTQTDRVTYCMLMKRRAEMKDVRTTVSKASKHLAMDASSCSETRTPPDSTPRLQSEPPPKVPEANGERTTCEATPLAPDGDAKVVVAGVGEDGEAEVRPKDYLLLTIFSCICPIWPINIIGFVFSIMSRNSFAGGDVDGARRLGRVAKLISLGSIMGGTLLYLISSCVIL
uniref:Proline-rich transmembrane protein 2 n=1 Tax=Eptatretus burgeri TaxID=7764 RepID=A0A8C4X0U0_EPTBU